MITKISGVLLAFLLFMTLVAGSFAAYPSETCATKFTDLTGHSIQKGQTVTFQTTLWVVTQTGFHPDSWSKLRNQPVTYTVSNSNNIELFTETKKTSIWNFGVSTFKVDTKKHGMCAGLYHVTVKYNGATNMGNTKDTYLPSEAKADLIVYD
jgi:hypothetical protein